MKLHNREMVWELILGSRPVSRARLAKMTEMSPTSITRIVGDLLEFGLLVEEPDTHGGVGRRAILLDVNADALFTVGIDIDVHSVNTCLLDLNNRPRITLQRRHGKDLRSPAGVVETACAMYGEMVADTGVSKDKVKAVGISVGGTVDHEQGIVKVSPQLHWKNVALRDLAEKAFGVPAILENDVKAAILEEYVCHRENRAGNVAYLTIGSGIGAALMYEGKLLRGGSNAAGEIGHTTVQPSGELCDCGRYGCLYTCLSEQYLLAAIHRFAGADAGIDQWIAAQRADETWANGLASEAAGYIAMALNQLLCSYDPQIIIVGGRLIQANPELLGIALQKKGLIYEALGSDARIVPSRTPNRDALIGAAILARSLHLDRLLHER
jgi:predicted NBD/HSP70 family sugar kinase